MEGKELIIRLWKRKLIRLYTFCPQLTAREARLHESEQSVKLLRLSRWFKLWKDAFIGRQRLKRSMLGFPAAPSMQSPSQQVGILLYDYLLVEDGAFNTVLFISILNNMFSMFTVQP